MKKLTTIILTAAIIIFGAGKTMIVHHSNGSTYETALYNIDSITFVDIGTPTEMILIPAKDNSFQMGMPGGDSYHTPVHSVTFTYNFYMDPTEVTQKQFEEIMQSTYPSFHPPQWTTDCGLGDAYPAYDVSWYDAVLYCNARSKTEGRDTVYSYDRIIGVPGQECSLTNISFDIFQDGYRLPTEAEWEYACRGRSTTKYFWGDSLDSRYYVSASLDDGCEKVATKLPNQFGLYDISGNLWEWCNDKYGSYDSASVINPLGPINGSSHVVRGGGWWLDKAGLLSAYRDIDFYVDKGNYYFGFRTVCTNVNL